MFIFNLQISHLVFDSCGGVGFINLDILEGRGFVQGNSKLPVMVTRKAVSETLGCLVVITSFRASDVDVTMA